MKYLNRSKGRERRYKDVDEDDVFVRGRLKDFETGAMPVLTTLSQDYPYYVIDGTQPIESSSAELNRIYQESKLSDS